MVNTSNSAELENCIENAQKCMMDMGKIIEQLPANNRGQLSSLCKKTEELLQEAKQRCDQLL